MQPRTGMVTAIMLIGLTLITSCGGGSNNAPIVAPTTTTSNPPTADVAIVIDRTASARTMVMRAAPVPTMARISVTNANLNGISYKQIQDLTIPGSATLTIPIGSGYTFELVTYTTGSFNLVEEYAVTPNVQILAGSNSVTLTLNPITVSLTVPASISTGQSYSISVTPPSPSPFQQAWRAAIQTTPITAPLHATGYSVSTSVLTLIAPTNNNQPGTVYFQSEFYLKPSMLNTGELSSNWAFIYPNAAWGDAPITAPLIVPSGTVTIVL